MNSFTRKTLYSRGRLISLVEMQQKKFEFSLYPKTLWERERNFTYNRIYRKKGIEEISTNVLTG